MYGEERLFEFISNLGKLNPDETCYRVFEDIKTFAENPNNISDDLTLMVSAIKSR